MNEQQVKAIMEAILRVSRCLGQEYIEVNTVDLKQILAEQLGECIPHISPAYNDKGEILEDFALVHLKYLGYDKEPAPPEDNVCKSAKDCNLNESLTSQKVDKCQWCGSESIRKYCISCDNLQLPEFHKDGEA